VSASPDPAHEADLDLARRMAAGDALAFDAFGERYFAALYRFALSRLGGERELARDTVQATFAKALSRIETYRGDAALLTWLCACWRNEVRMALRSKPAGRFRRLEAPDLDTLASANPSPDESVLRSERDGWVHASLDTLPEHQARALEWKYVERLSTAEIAQRTGTTPKAVESLLGRAREAFRRSYHSLAAAGEERLR
jgi:RNA polymerase sigma-70 factor (ECF subfamily)